MRGTVKVLQKLGIVSIALLAWSGAVSAQSWTAVLGFPGGSAGTAMLRTHGNVMVQDSDTGQWYELVPDLTGSYSNGSWSALNPAPNGYAPRFYGSAVLPDDRILFEGGEYNFGVLADTKLGAIYNELSNTWQSVAAPMGWNSIGDAPTVVLASGTFMMGDCCSTKQALLTNPTTLTWTSTGAGKADPNSEEGWTLLPAATGNKVLTVDTQNGSRYELYDPTSGTWSSPGSTPSFLGNTCGMPIVPEMGPAVLRPNGNVFVVGGNGKTAIYNSSAGTWSVGPTIPGGLVAADAPGALLPDGHVLIMASPCMAPPASFFEYDGSDLDPVPGPPNAVNDASYHGHMLILPRAGHILFTDGTTDVEIYTPAGGASDRWKPTISSFPGQVVRGASYTIKGTKLSGFSQGAAYGDDVQTATNFPLVRMIDSLGNVYYARTYNFSSMAVQTGATVASFTFVPPTAMAAGPATLVVVTNGIASVAVTVDVS